MISKEDVRHVANLSRIHLSDDQIEKFTQNLESILDYVTKLEELDVSQVQPTSHVLELKNVYREDKVDDSFTQEQALSFAIEKDRESFKVPKVIE